MERKHEGDGASSPEILRKPLTLAKKQHTQRHNNHSNIEKKPRDGATLPQGGEKREGRLEAEGESREEGRGEEGRGGERGRRGDGKKREGGKRRVRGEGPHSCVTFVAPHVDVSPNAVAMPVTLRMETSTRMDVATSRHHTPFGPQTTEKKKI